MRAQAGPPFDSTKHVFEVLWDGFGAMAHVERGGYRVLNRRQNDVAARYPELGFLVRVPPGTVLDGELVLLRDGKPDFEALLRRERLGGDLAVQAASANEPVMYVVFDLLYEAFESQMDRPLVERRERLAALVAGVEHPGLVLSEGAIGGGTAFFGKIQQLGLAGMIAKDLESRYEPGERSGAWVKVLDPKVLLCAIVGWQPDAEGGVEGLILAATASGGLHPVGTVTAGLTDEVRDRLRAPVAARAIEAPFVSCDVSGRWVGPGLYAKVRFRERAGDGTLRDPVFIDLVIDDDPTPLRS